MDTRLTDKRALTFYDRMYSSGQYSTGEFPEEHSRFGELAAFVRRYQLHDKRCLEIGCGRGTFQDFVDDYVGVDVSESVRSFLHKPFALCSATHLPFENGVFDAVWTLMVLEHVVEPELALEEMRRVLKPGGLLLLSPAWHCRPWAAQGYPVRPYGDFDWKGKLVKASVPIRDSVVFRASYTFPRRTIRYLRYIARKEPMSFQYKKLNPNYEHFLMGDADAVSSMDPYEAILWFCSRGDECLNHPDLLSQFLVRHGGLIFRVKKTSVIDSLAQGT